jgi:cardiolipin synthase A/B
VTTGIPFVRTGPYPVREGNSVRLLVDGIPAFRGICGAIDAAKRNVWATVTFMFWRLDDDLARFRRNAFWGSREHIAMLDERRSGIKIRWDRASPGFCQHAKTWSIDAGRDSATAFVGGINLNPHSQASPGHTGERQNHDAYLELRGPSVVDVHHAFVQHWNEASERLSVGGMWGVGSETELTCPKHVPSPRGETIA